MIKKIIKYDNGKQLCFKMFFFINLEMLPTILMSEMTKSGISLKTSKNKGGWGDEMRLAKCY